MHHRGGYLMFKVAAVISRDSLDGTLKTLKWLPRKISDKILSKAVGVASRKLSRAVKNAVPVRTGQLKKSIGARVRRYKDTQIIVGVVGAKKGFRVEVGKYKRDSRKTARYPHKAGDPIIVNPTKYLHLVELGTIRSREFKILENTTNSMKPTIRAEMIKAINVGIEKYAKGTL
jgi:HK97 gp10 family phage protein